MYVLSDGYEHTIITYYIKYMWTCIIFLSLRFSPSMYLSDAMVLHEVGHVHLEKFVSQLSLYIYNLQGIYYGRQKLLKS